MNKLTNSQLKTLVDIFVGVGMIGLGTVALPAVLDKGNPGVIFLGIVTTLTFWYTAIRISKRIK